ncbi:MAG TPA: PIN domain-containing protein [Bryobacteraceae bacterium]|nr:PIN domain-containing protein [Bryobacteraceae bacterium]
MTIAAVVDTHTALWHLFDDARLSAAAAAFINGAAITRRKIAISTISLAEVVYLIEKSRLPRAEVPDRPDRIVAATAGYQPRRAHPRPRA